MLQIQMSSVREPGYDHLSSILTCSIAEEHKRFKIMANLSVGSTAVSAGFLSFEFRIGIRSFRPPVAKLWPNII